MVVIGLVGRCSYSKDQTDTLTILYIRPVVKQPLVPLAEQHLVAQQQRSTLHVLRLPHLTLLSLQLLRSLPLSLPLLRSLHHIVHRIVQLLRITRHVLLQQRILLLILLQQHTIHRIAPLQRSLRHIVQQQPLQLPILRLIIRPDQLLGRLTFMHSITYTDNPDDKDIPNLLSEKVKKLTVVEDYFLEKVKEYDFEVCYDCTAEEPVVWKTLNYTTYAGCFIMHPLRGQAAKQQMMDAYVHGSYNNSWITYFNEKLKRRDASKYKRGPERDTETIPDVDILVVLAGHNKIAKHTCAGSLLRLHSLSDNVWYKRHPISNQKVYDDLFNHLKAQGVKNINVVEEDMDLYDQMQFCGRVATGFASESALYTVADGLPLICTDLYQNKNTAPFYHINWFLFYEEDPAYFVNKAFDSYKSGIINPDVDTDWKYKVDQYLSYISNQRKKYGGMYVS